MPNRHAYDEPVTAIPIDGEVVLSGPDALAVALTPAAAEESAARMIAAAAVARGQDPQGADDAASV